MLRLEYEWRSIPTPLVGLMRCAILFTYYRNPTSCEERLRILRRINPGMRIYGLYSGSHQGRADFQAVQAALDADYSHPEREPQWLWRNYDKVICEWFRNGGEQLEWDFLFIHSWDLLLLEPISTFSDPLGSGQVLLPGLRTLEQMDEQVIDPRMPPLVPGRWRWANEPDFTEFLAYLKQHYSSAAQIYCEVSPFAIISRPCCVAYNAVAGEIPGFNEYRFATVAHLLGIAFARPHLPPWFWKRYDPDRHPLSSESVLTRDTQLFHPVYYPVTCEDLGL